MVEVERAVTEREFMARPNQLNQVDVCRHDASQILEATKPLPGEFSAACAWELESEMEARGVEPLFYQNVSIDVHKHLKIRVI